MGKSLKRSDSPVIIIAAARSGTKMLRAALAASPELTDFPYDVNYIWMYGNYQMSHDELTDKNLTPKIESFIKKQFNQLLSKSSTANTVLEKTVSNSLRTVFVKAVFPKCKIIHLYRDGRDVAADARLCWQSSMFSERIQPKTDIIKKMIDFPIVAAWPYLKSYAATYAKRIVSREKHVDSWGPRFKGLEEAFRKHSLIEICGMQWNRSVELTLQSLASLRENKDYINVRYEDLVQRPENELKKIAEFLEIRDFSPIREYSKKIKKEYVGFWRKTLTAEEIEKLLPHIKPNLDRLQYEDNAGSLEKIA